MKVEKQSQGGNLRKYRRKELEHRRGEVGRRMKEQAEQKNKINEPLIVVMRYMDNLNEPIYEHKNE